MNVVIVGCGRVGATLATTLDQNRHQVTIVDIDQRAFGRLHSDFTGRAVVGTAIDEDVLLSAGIDSADAFLAVTSDDNTNLMAAQIARRVFSVQHVTAQVDDPVRAEIFKDLQVETICPTTTIASLFLAEIPGGQTLAEEQDR